MQRTITLTRVGLNGYAYIVVRCGTVVLHKKHELLKSQLFIP